MKHVRNVEDYDLEDPGMTCHGVAIHRLSWVGCGRFAYICMICFSNLVFLHDVSEMEYRARDDMG